MGTWGHEFHQNDDAADFLETVSDERQWTSVDKAIQDYVSAGGYDDAATAVAAIELVAAALGSPNDELDPDLAEWAAGHQSKAAAIRDEALRALDLVADKSELSELWAEAVVDPTDAQGWRDAIAGLRSRLEA